MMPASWELSATKMANIRGRRSEIGTLDGIKILLIEDNEATVWGISILLGKRGCIVKNATSASDALEIIPEFQPHVMLIDIGLPDMDGCSLAEQIRSRSDSKAVLIAATGYDDDDTAERIKSAGFVYHLVKPIEFDELYDLLRKINPAEPNN